VMQFPVVADPYGKIGDKSARIISIGALNQSGAALYQGSLNVLKASSGHWAYTRPVWNQIMYNSVNVNDDVSAVRYPVNPATFFPGADRATGTDDDVQPFNAFLKQMETLNDYGMPLWPAADGVFDESSVSRTGDSITVKVCITNLGAVAMGDPVYLTVYKDYIDIDSIIKIDSISGYIDTAATVCRFIGIPNIKSKFPFVRLVIRFNDKGGVYPVLDECNYGDSITLMLNPALDLMMTKDATLNPGKENAFKHNGTYPNPVSVLYNEKIKYEIIAVNANLKAGNMTITDTLPPYLNYVSGSVSGSADRDDTSMPGRMIISWNYSGVASYFTDTVSYEATPESGVSASQPLFPNKAWVRTPDNLLTPTNVTYHQGAGVAVVTFSASTGGSIFGASTQAVDYRSKAHSGVIVAPDEGYTFVGWQHETYISLRGETIPAAFGIMHYDTLTIHGDVKLHAVFKPEKYAVRYHLNNGVNAATNPAIYTIETEMITLAPAQKSGDEFIGWTGSNSDMPQMVVTIPQGSIGEREYFANYLLSGCEDESILKEKDEIWSADNTLYVETVKKESVIRIYTTEGVLQRVYTAVNEGMSTFRLTRGIYVVTINNSVGTKVVIKSN